MTPFYHRVLLAIYCSVLLVQPLKNSVVAPIATVVVVVAQNAQLEYRIRPLGNSTETRKTSNRHYSTNSSGLLRQQQQQLQRLT